MADEKSDVVDAIRDLTRIVIAVQGSFSSRSEAIRRLHDLSIPAKRIAAIFDIPTKDVHSVLLKAKKSK